MDDNEENIFGKMRGRFDVAAAEAAVQRVADDVFYGFMSLPNEKRREFANKLVEHFRFGKVWRLTESEK